MTTTQRLGAAGLALLLVPLAGCASARRTGGEALALPPVTVNEFIAMQPAARKQEIAAAERDVRAAERQAERADLLVPVAERQLEIARAELNAREAAVTRTESRLALVRKQHQATFAGVPAGSQTVPEDVQQALERFEAAEHDLDVARWEAERADAAARVREEELAYARAFREAARRDTELQRARVELARIEVVRRATADVLPGVTDPRLAEAQSRVQEAQAGYAKAHADATARLATAQLRRAGMAHYQSGPPPRLSLSGAGDRSGASGLLPPAVRIEPEPLPWPDAWEEPAAGRPSS